MLSVAGRMYEAATAPDRLPEIGALIREAMQVESGIVYICERSSGRMLHLVSASENFDARALADYAAHYHAINPWFGRALLRTPPYTARGEELIEPGAFRRTEFAADWCTRVGIYHMIGSTRPVAPGIVVGAGIHRTRRSGGFSAEEAAFYDTVTAHAARAIQIAWRLGMSESLALAAEEAAHALGSGVLLVDGNGRLVFASRVAERMLSDGRWITLRAGRIRARHPGDRRRLDAAIGAASNAGGSVAEGLVPLRAPDGRMRSVFVAPFRPDAGPGVDSGASVLIHVSDPDAVRAPFAVEIGRAFGLTPAEARLAAAITRGQRLGDHAAAAGVSVNTSKTLLARVFRKTGTERQAELVALLLADPVLRLSAEPVHPG